MRVEWLQPARDDRAQITLWMRRRSRKTAARILRELIAAADSLTTFPNKGRPGLVPGTRELLSVRPYIIVYRVEAEGDIVQIVRVWHRAQDRSKTE